jgi:hypothetical protein
LDLPPEKLLDEVFHEDPEPVEKVLDRARETQQQQLWKPPTYRQQDVALAIIVMVSVIGICVLSSIMTRLNYIENEIKLFYRASQAAAV